MHPERSNSPPTTDGQPYPAQAGLSSSRHFSSGTFFSALMILDPMGALRLCGELLSISVPAPAFSHGYTIQAWSSMAKA
jgi:hypothetical protein